MEVLATLIDPEHGTGNADQLGQRAKAESLRLEDALEEWQVDHTGLAGQGAKNCVVEHLVPEEWKFAAQDGLAFAAAGQGVKHVEQDEAREGHCGIVGGHHARSLAQWLPVGDVTHLMDVDSECANHDDHGGCENALDERLGEHSRCLGTWGAIHD